MHALTIGRAARKTGIPVETIRYYERRGILPRPPRPSDGGPRDYGGDTLDRLRFIRAAQGLGFTLAEIDDLRALLDSDRASCAEVRTRAEQTRDALRRKIARLSETVRALDSALAGCPGEGALSRCSILRTITRHGPPQDGS